VAVFGAGPVGLLAAHSSYLRGADQVFVVDLEPDRLALAERFGATLIIAGKATPSLLVSHGLSLDDAPDAYARFDQRADGYAKGCCTPDGVTSRSY
jgi:threonine dehydrogenase-like Zn-dependent dehydrogenase